jgi:flavorubredoxin
MAKVLIVCATRTGETLKIGELIAEGIRFSGHEAKVMNVNTIKKETELQGYDGFAFGSGTYHGEMIQGMKTFLAFGWSGEAPDRIFDTMKNIFKMDMVGGSLRLKTSSLGGGVQMAQDYGREIAEKL